MKKLGAYAADRRSFFKPLENQAKNRRVEIYIKKRDVETITLPLLGNKKRDAENSAVPQLRNKTEDSENLKLPRLRNKKEDKL